MHSRGVAHSFDARPRDETDDAVDEVMYEVSRDDWLRARSDAR